jgi:hypothetical protein
LYLLADAIQDAAVVEAFNGAYFLLIEGGNCKIVATLYF